jgi:hypothetical protein
VQQQHATDDDSKQTSSASRSQGVVDVVSGNIKNFYDASDAHSNGSWAVHPSSKKLDFTCLESFRAISLHSI